MAKSRRADFCRSLKKVMLSKPVGDVAEKLCEQGLPAKDNSDVVAAALFNKAAKGEITAIKELRDILQSEDEKDNNGLTKLYAALQQED